MADPRLRRLASVPLLSALNQRQLRKILRGSLEYVYEPGETFVRQGEHGQTMFVILSGSAKVVRRGRTVARLGVGDVFGEIAVIDAHPRTASVVADTEVHCLVLHRDHLREILADEPKAAWALLEELAGRLRERL
jgi:CRP-like cAMP-binding protein